jgi:methyltransferase-like protein
MGDERSTTYDAVVYEGSALPETHPDRLAALAKLFGMSPPGPGACSVLELGCGTGSNLIPMALSMPGARFLGIDLSTRQVEQGQAVIGRLGLENVELRAMSILDFDEGLGPFDYILCHGVYSWVPDDVQDKILRICGEGLSPQGIAYISYNTYPGWHIRNMAREMMILHTAGLADPAERARRGRDLLQVLAQALQAGGDPYSRCVVDEAAQIVSKPDYYLVHEHFAELNRPIYFREFRRRAVGHGLRYLAESRLGSMACVQPPDVAELLGYLSPDPDDWEQYCDFLAGRRFRQTLLCRSDVELARVPCLEAIQTLWASSATRPGEDAVDGGPSAPAEFRSLDGQSCLATSDPLIVAIMRSLHEIWPRSLSFDELRARAQARLASPRATGATDLSVAVLEGFKSRVVDLHAHEPRFACEPGERPLGSPLARLQATAGPEVTNLRHQSVGLKEFDRLVLHHLDGRRDRAGILSALEEVVADGGFTIKLKDRPPITDSREARPLLERLLDPSLGRLAGFALLLE